MDSESHPQPQISSYPIRPSDRTPPQLVLGGDEAHRSAPSTARSSDMPDASLTSSDARRSSVDSVSEPIFIANHHRTHNPGHPKLSGKQRSKPSGGSGILAGMIKAKGRPVSGRSPSSSAETSEDDAEGSRFRAPKSAGLPSRLGGNVIAFPASDAGPLKGMPRSSEPGNAANGKDEIHELSLTANSTHDRLAREDAASSPQPFSPVEKDGSQASQGVSLGPTTSAQASVPDSQIAPDGATKPETASNAQTAWTLPQVEPARILPGNAAALAAEQGARHSVPHADRLSMPSVGSLRARSHEHLRGAAQRDSSLGTGAPRELRLSDASPPLAAQTSARPALPTEASSDAQTKSLSSSATDDRSPFRPDGGTSLAKAPSLASSSSRHLWRRSLGPRSAQNFRQSAADVFSVPSTKVANGVSASKSSSLGPLSIPPPSTQPNGRAVNGPTSAPPTRSFTAQKLLPREPTVGTSMISSPRSATPDDEFGSSAMSRASTAPQAEGSVRRRNRPLTMIEMLANEPPPDWSSAPPNAISPGGPRSSEVRAETPRRSATQPILAHQSLGDHLLPPAPHDGGQRLSSDEMTAWEFLGADRRSVKAGKARQVDGDAASTTAGRGQTGKPELRVEPVVDLITMFGSTQTRYVCGPRKSKETCSTDRALPHEYRTSRHAVLTIPSRATSFSPFRLRATNVLVQGHSFPPSRQRPQRKVPR